jgi:hypothetical protein
MKEHARALVKPGAALRWAGRSNAEIAGSLFVSRATIESHLHSAYLKLDISSRGRLAGVLAASVPWFTRDRWVQGVHPYNDRPARITLAA